MALPSPRSRAAFAAFAAAFALLVPARPARAAVGSTASIGGLADGTAWVPSLDWREPRWLVQVHLLDQLAPLARNEAFYPRLGAEGSIVAYRADFGGPARGVVMPGLGFRVEGLAPVGWNVTTHCRLGVEVAKGVGLGAYVVPALGVSTLVSGTPNVTYGGTLQVSAWIGD